MIVTERVGDISVSYEINNDKDLELYTKLQALDEPQQSTANVVRVEGGFTSETDAILKGWFANNTY